MPKSKDDTRRRYVSEPLASEAAIAKLSAHFDFLREVRAVSAIGDKYSIDAVAICREQGWTIGFEFKRSHLFMKEFCPALRQAIHYRLATIQDERLPDYKDKQLPAMALFPDWLGEHDDDVSNYEFQADGMRLLAAQFRVGTMREKDDSQFAFIMGQCAIWHSASGWTKNAEGVLFGNRGLGSARKKDR